MIWNVLNIKLHKMIWRTLHGTPPSHSRESLSHKSSPVHQIDVNCHRRRTSPPLDFDPKLLEATNFTLIPLILSKFAILWSSKFLVVKRREMEKVMNILKPKPNPQQQLRDWQRRLRQECRNVERQIRGNGSYFRIFRFNLFRVFFYVSVPCEVKILIMPSILLLPLGIL